MSRAALLRRLKPGVELRLVYRSSDGTKNLPRIVTRATASIISMSGPDYPRHHRLHIAKVTIRETPNGFEVVFPGAERKNLLRYEWAAGDQLELKD